MFYRNKQSAIALFLTNGYVNTIILEIYWQLSWEYTASTFVWKFSCFGDSDENKRWPQLPQQLQPP